jgi:hypothetical protein
MRLWKQLQRSWKSLAAVSNTPRRQRPRLVLETLEQRDVPTAVFAPHFGTETVTYHGGDLLNSPDVHLIFWGPDWQTPTLSQLASDIQTRAGTLLSGPYLSGLAQYSVAGHPITGHAQLGKVVFDTSTVPNNFSADNLRDVINHQVDIGALPEADVSSQEPIYVVLTPPGFTSNEPNAAGFHSHFTRFDFPIDFDGMNFAWVSGGSSATLDSYTRIFSHEIAETIVDPDPESGFTSNQPGFPSTAGNTEIADWEAEGRFGYTFRVDGVLAQAYFSPADQAFIVPDGNQQKFVLIRNFVGTTATDTFTLVLNGDQRASNADNLLLFTTNTGGVAFFQNGETAQFNPGAITSVDINMGNGTDGVNVVSTPTGVPVFIIQGGAAATTINLFPSGSGLFLGKIQSDIFFTGPVSTTGNESFSTSVINVNDTLNNSTLPQSWTISDNTLQGSPLGFSRIHYIRLGDLNISTNGNVNNFLVTGTDGAAHTTINTAGSTDLFKVERTQQNTTLTINSGAGNNLINLGDANLMLDAILGPVVVHGGGADTLHLFDQNSVRAATYTLDATSFTTTNATSVSYAGIQNLILDGAAGVTNLNRDYNIRGLGASGATTVNAKGLINHFNVGATDGTLNGFAPAFTGPGLTFKGRLNLNGANSIDTIVVNDSQNTAAGTTYTINAGSLTRVVPFAGLFGSNQVTIAYTTGFGSSVELDTANGGATIQDHGTNVFVNLLGGSGADTLVGPNLVNTWGVTGFNQGTLPNLSFRGIENLTGGTTSDTFAFANGARVTGRIDGGTGNNTLNFARYTTDVTANLILHTATGAGGGIAHISNVTGGAGNDILVGDAFGNVLIGGQGRNILIGGLNGDILNATTGGLGQDILISGRTAFDANAAALNLIKAEWTRPDNLFSTYKTRVAHLLAGGGLNGTVLLNPTTVFADGNRDTVSTSATTALDFLFLDSADVLSLPLKPHEQVIHV